MKLPGLLRTRPSREAPLGREAFNLLSLTLLAVLLAHMGHLPWWLTALSAATLAARWWQRTYRGGRVPFWLKLPLLAALPAALLGYYGTIFGRGPGSALAVGLLMLKLMESERPRDARMGVAFACFVLMSALLFNQGLLATALVALALVPALATLNAVLPTPQRPAWRASAWSVLRIVALSLPLALVAFLFVPRLSSPLWGAPNADKATTGISDSMSPGNFTDLLIDDSPAFRVTFQGAPPPPQQRYFRGPVMSYFDGRTWHARPLRALLGDRRTPEPLQAQGPTLSYNVTLEATHQHWLFALDVPQSAPAGARLTHARSLLRRQRIDQSTHYVARSATDYRLAPQASAAERRRNLELPAGFDPEARALAAQWRQRYGANAPAIARAALDLFHDHGFRYNLAAPPLGRDSVDDFLFDTREGFCEHYASAFTFLMRAAGIPARVVTGYQGGFWNTMGQYLLVRQSDAHAWSEVWIDGRGWVRYDPTAAVRPDRVTLGAGAAAGDQAPWYQRGWLQHLRNRWDIVNQWWGQAVIGFDSLRQRGLLTPFGVSRADTGTLAAVLAALTCLLLAAGLAFTLWRRPRVDRLRQAMAKLERKLARAGVARRLGEGPHHYLSRAARALPQSRVHLKALETTYLQLRYAQDNPSVSAIHAFSRQVGNFRPRGVVK
ncbi:DUF3488 and transglutaminase-like domain-containing protein [Oleiagrimonas sp. C23AA]|uniref:transglutaminase TgpA family protein n=1 Tax=Oleiagrimonas sp. C23AA TaxID=2719047 RepID=UPI00142369D0|nr:DUF3488 and transglutaminase-like domain-containing protein [Oleiagrimonas sp. C23AA]NII10308.1 DUF3488 domain-containing transglutaminase family protein [Oleiagrimonas sp. C23AA]